MSTSLPTVDATVSNRSKIRISHLLLYLVLIAGAVLIVLPFIYMLSTSLKPMPEVFATPVKWIPSEWKWDNFATVWREHPIDRYFRNSIIVAVSVTFLNLLTCSLAGYSFAKFDYPGRTLMFGVVLATLMIPLASMIIPLFMVVKSLGWVDSYWGLILPAGTSAFGIFLMRQHMTTIPNDLLDAARLDGASEPRIFGGIILPMSKTALSSLAIFIFMWNWDSFFWPLLVTTNESYRTLPLGIALFESSYGTNYPQLMAVALMAMLPVLIVFLVLQRNFIEALTMSGVKG
ncbi:MAG: carbohydrate ABC transporter permease [Thermomicrobiales bacterium]|nr:carbohydrate ABC transporter permease [Thermomicrobiales bacterium]MCO5222826.1 carbohydrate ABC transporter permease [Thermomicrobiales bacterium]